MKTNRGRARCATSARILTLVLCLTLPSFSAEARDPGSLGGLTVDASRVPDGHPASWFDGIDLSTWGVTEVSAQSCADNSGNDDGAAIQAAINSAPPRTIVFLRGNGSDSPCTYNIRQRIHINRSEVVVRGRGMETTTLKNHASNHTFWVGSYQKRPVNQGSTTWTGGYAKDARTLQLASTSGFAPGSWIFLRANYPSDAIQTTGAFGYGAKVTSVGNGTVTIDRGLPVSFATGSQRAHRWTDRAHHVGLEDMTLVDSNPEVQFQDNLVLFEGTTESWMQGVRFDEGDNRYMEIQWSARDLLRGNVFQGLLYPRVSANNHRALVISYATTDTVIENNAFLSDVPRGVTIERTGVRTYVAYNFFDDPGNNLCHDNRPGGGGRSIFHHGFYSHSSIVEGNDTRCKIEVDNYWGNQGPFITYYRNRVRTGGSPNWEGMLGTEEFGTGEQSYINYLANHVAYMWTSGGRGLDRSDTAIHGERNVIREQCALQQLGGAIDPGCSSDTGTGTTNSTTVWRDNAVSTDVAPASWADFDAPDSLIYDEAPSWWCQESCGFSAQAGIGAFGDDYSGGLCQLPAERAARGLSCTPLGSSEPPPDPPSVQPPQAPILLP